MLQIMNATRSFMWQTHFRSLYHSAHFFMQSFFQVAKISKMKCLREAALEEVEEGGQGHQAKRDKTSPNSMIREIIFRGPERAIC